MSKLHKRVVTLYAVTAVFFMMVLLRVFTVSSGTQFAEAAQQNSTLSLQIPESRGIFYDCNGEPLVGGQDGYLAAVSPEPEAATALADVLGPQEMDNVLDRMGEGKPFLLKIPTSVSAPGLVLFPSYSRYEDGQTVNHLLGYTDNTRQQGLSGLEKAYDSFLTGALPGGKIVYSVNALGRPLSGISPQVENTRTELKKGIKLTLDKDIQSIAQKAADEYIPSGAVVVLEVPTGKIRASVSTPSFTMDTLADAMNSQDAPLVNRALQNYNVGSSFKLVTAAAALEAGYTIEWEHECTGSVDVAGVVFHCYNNNTHGNLTMEGALAKSCNTYFISLAREIGYEPILSMAKRLGFGSSLQLCSGISTPQGVLPTENVLASPAAVANFAFGQGDLLATPMQMASLVNCIASDGILTTPSLVECFIEEDGEETQVAQVDGLQAVSPDIARTLQKMMAAPLSYGTATTAMPDSGGAGGKTATAQTGIFNEEGEPVNQSWFVGYFPYENPQYAVAILAEDTIQGSKTTNPAFKYIADHVPVE